MTWGCLSNRCVSNKLLTTFNPGNALLFGGVLPVFFLISSCATTPEAALGWDAANGPNGSRAICKNRKLPGFNELMDLGLTGELRTDCMLRRCELSGTEVECDDQGDLSLEEEYESFREGFKNDY